MSNADRLLGFDYSRIIPAISTDADRVWWLVHLIIARGIKGQMFRNASSALQSLLAGRRAQSEQQDRYVYVRGCRWNKRKYDGPYYRGAKFEL